MRIESFFSFNSLAAEMKYKRNKYAKQNLLPAFHLWDDVMVRSSRSHATRTHTRAHIHSVFMVVFVVALTFMLIANGVTNIIYWIKIRNSILSWEFQSRNCTKQFHDYSIENTRLRLYFNLTMCGQT